MSKIEMFDFFKKFEDEKQFSEKDVSKEHENSDSSKNKDLEQLGKVDFVKNINNADSVKNKKSQEKLEGKGEDYFANFDLQMEKAFDEFIASKEFEKLIAKNADKEKIQDSFNKWIGREYRKLDFMKENEIDKKVVKKTRFELYGIEDAESLKGYRESVLKEKDEKKEREAETPSIDVKEMKGTYSPKEGAKDEDVKEFKEDVSTYVSSINFEGSENVIDFMKKGDIEGLQKYIAPEGSEIYKEYADHAKFWGEKNNPLRSGDFNQATFVALKDFAQKKIEGYGTDGRSTSTKEDLDQLEQKNNQIDQDNFKKFESMFGTPLKNINFRKLRFIEGKKYSLFIDVDTGTLKYKGFGRENFEIEFLGPDGKRKTTTFYIEKHEATENSPEEITIGRNDVFGGDK